MSDSGYANSDKSEQLSDSFVHNRINQSVWGSECVNNRYQSQNNFRRPSIHHQLQHQQINWAGEMASEQLSNSAERVGPLGQTQIKPPPVAPKPARPQTLTQPRSFPPSPSSSSSPSSYNSGYTPNTYQGIKNPLQRQITASPNSEQVTKSGSPRQMHSTNPDISGLTRGPPPSYEYHLQKRYAHSPNSRPVSTGAVSHKIQRSVDSTSSSDTSQRNGSAGRNGSSGVNGGASRNGSDFGSSGSLPLGYGGWSPSASVVRAAPQSDEDRKQAQVAAYTQWVNIQLKRRPGSRPIEDLQRDMQDGVALAHLIEIIAGVSLEDIHENPRCEAEMEANVESVIHFMTSRRIRMHHITASDIVSGNIKPIMRLILALAAHFKPNSVRQSSSSTKSQQQPTRGGQQTVAGLAQGAAAALADIKRDALRTSQRPRRPRHLQQQHRQEEQEHHHHQQSTAHGAPAVSPRPKTVGGGMYPQQALPATTPTAESSGGIVDDSASDVSASFEVNAEMYAALQEEHAALQVQMAETRTTLLSLQDLLLNGRIPDGCAASSTTPDAESSSPANDSHPAEANSAEEEVVLWKARLHQAEEVTAQLRIDLSKAKQECMQLQGVKSGLAERLREQEESLLAMKAELLRAGFCQQTLDTSNTDLVAKLEERDRSILDLRRELAKRERELDDIKAEQEVEREQRESIAGNLRTQITELHGRLRRVGETEATLSARVASQDRKMARLEGNILQQQPHGGGTTPGSHQHHQQQLHHRSQRSQATQQQSGGVSSDEYQLVRDSLQSLRTRFPGNQAHNHSIDQLESSISSLMDRLQAREQDSLRMAHNHGRQDNHTVSNTPGSGDNSRATKVLYFTDRTVTPFMCTVHKRLGEVTLADIKSLIDRPSSYRYHFKAMDPEFGTVKEEISHDEDVIPGWEGKIIAWIEEDHG